MALTDTLPCDVMPVADGVLVVPYVLPIHVPQGAEDLTVREWLNLSSTPQDTR